MKRLSVTPLTPEDWAIFSSKLRTGCWPLCAHLEYSGRNADRRDAELMLSFATGHRAFLVYSDVGPWPSKMLKHE